MAVYYIGSYDIENMELFSQYPPKVAALLPKYGGEVLASDLHAICLEGQARTLNAIIRFPSEEAALGMFHDPLYQEEIRGIRLNSTKNIMMVLVKGRVE